MKLLALIPVLLLTGCLSTPVKVTFPDIPEDLKTSCPDLKEIEQGETKLSKVVSVISENYGTYHECKIKADAWLEWYKTQKQIMDSVK